MSKEYLFGHEPVPDASDIDLNELDALIEKTESDLREYKAVRAEMRTKGYKPRLRNYQDLGEYLQNRFR